MVEPLAEGHPSGAATQELTLTANANFDQLELTAAAVAGDTVVRITGPDVAFLVVGSPPIASQRLIVIGTGPQREFGFATIIAPDGANRIVTLSTPLRHAHAQATAVTSPDTGLVLAGTLSVAANAGDQILFGPNTGTVANVLVIERGTANEEIRAVGRLATLPLALGAYAEYPAGTAGAAITVVADARAVTNLLNDRRVPLNSVTGITPGMTLTDSAANIRNIVAVDPRFDIVEVDTAFPAAPTDASAATVNPGALGFTVNNWPSQRVLPIASSVASIAPGMTVTREPPGPDTGTVAAVYPDVNVVVLAADFAMPALAAVGTMRIGGAVYTLRVFDTTDVVSFDRVDGLAPGQQVTINGDQRAIAAVNTTLRAVRLQTPLTAPPAVGDAVALEVAQLTADVGAGATTLPLSNRVGLNVGDLLQIGVAPNEELVSVTRVLGDRNAAPDAGTVQIGQALRRGYTSTTQVQRQHATPMAGRQNAVLVLGADVGDEELLVADGTSYVANDVIDVATPDGAHYFHRLDGNAVNANPQEIALDRALDHSHAAGEALAEREQLFLVEALDAGAWGNRLQVSARMEDTGLCANAAVLAANPPPGPSMFSSLQLASLTGVEAGTILELLDPAGTPITAPLLKVRTVDRTTRLALLDPPGLQPAHITAVAAALGAGQNARVRSREFSLAVYLLARPVPTVPSRNGNVQDGESFRHLSLDMRHSRYIERVIGVTFVDGADLDDRGAQVRRWDRRSEGASNLVRVLDLGVDDAARTAIRLSPELLVDTLPSGLPRAARQSLTGGSDLVPLMDDAMYVGDDSNEPTKRTGLFTLNNLLNVALVAIPGQTTAVVQQAVIDHCEARRYRFAVLDGPPPTNDTVADVQIHRSQFDTRYAALYHPWLTIPDPFPTTTATVRELAIPPAGHMLGIIARVDNDRGVHKAPANEVVRGITGLARYFTKGEQDILNPYPMQHQRHPRFPTEQPRPARVGARCITSDADWKYVNVRRLLIFIEDSIDRGLQWVVFEPNAEELWARVRRSVTNFLTTVWRNGALEGTKRRAGVLRQVRSDDDDAGRPRQRPPRVRDRRRAGEARRVRDHPHRSVDGRRRLASRRH